MKLLTVDSETFLIQPGLLAPPLVCVSFAQPGVPKPWLFDRQQGLNAVEGALDDGYTFVLHNGAFDFAVFCAARPTLIPKVFRAYAEGRVRDTKIRQELIDIAAGRKQEGAGSVVFRNNAWQKADYSLAGLEKMYLGRDRSADKTDPDSWRMRYHELDGVPIEQWPEKARTYAMEDAEGTLAVYLAQGGDIPNEVEQTRAAWALHLMSAWGIRTDGDMVTALESALLKEKEKAFRRLKKLGFYKAEPLSAEERRKGRVPDFIEPPKKEGKEPRQMKWTRDMDFIKAYVQRVYLRQNKRVPMTEGSDKRAASISTDRDTLNQSGSRILKMLGDAGGVDKILTTYVPVLKQGTEVPINARYQTIVNSGRTSSFQPNIQNLPTGRKVGGVRECFVPRSYVTVVEVPDNYRLRPGEEWADE